MKKSGEKFRNKKSTLVKKGQGGRKLRTLSDNWRKLSKKRMLGLNNMGPSPEEWGGEGKKK